MNISNNISSIQAHQTMLNTSANNVANLGSQASQTDLSKEMVTQMVVEDVTALNVTAIKTQDEMFGTLLDIKA